MPMNIILCGEWGGRLDKCIPIVYFSKRIEHIGNSSCSRHTEVASFRLLVAYSWYTKISEWNENVSLQPSSWALTPTHPSTPQLNIQLGPLGLILLVNPCHLFSSLVFHCSNWSTGMQCIATQPANLLHL